VSGPYGDNGAAEGKKKKFIHDERLGVGFSRGKTWDAKGGPGHCNKGKGPNSDQKPTKNEGKGVYIKGGNTGGTGIDFQPRGCCQRVAKGRATRTEENVVNKILKKRKFLKKESFIPMDREEFSSQTTRKKDSYLEGGRWGFLYCKGLYPAKMGPGERDSLSRSRKEITENNVDPHVTSRQPPKASSDKGEILWRGKHGKGKLQEGRTTKGRK